MESFITFRAMIEVLGKPKEHVEKALQTYLQHLKEDSSFQVVQVDIAEVKKQEKDELWATFADLEIKTEKVEHLISFCFDYMPSTLDIIEPAEFTLKDVELTNLLNDLQAHLHRVDMVAKQVKVENDVYKNNLGSLLHNYVKVLLTKGDLSAEQLSKLTGVTKEQLEDFLDKMIDKGVIDLKKGMYTLKKKEE
jgi:hypothetical protein